jgi:hypothetical protein
MPNSRNSETAVPVEVAEAPSERVDRVTTPEFTATAIRIKDAELTQL